MYRLKFIVYGILIAMPAALSAQTISSNASGFWDDPTIWSGGIVPASSNSTGIHIEPGHEVVLRDMRIADEVTVDTGGRLSISASGTLQLTDGTGTDLAIAGMVRVTGILESLNGSTIQSDSTLLFFEAGSSYKHRHSIQEGSLPNAWWDASSTVEILGFTTWGVATPSGNWSQKFGNFTWNTPLLTVPFDLQGRLSHIRGDIQIISTGSQRLVMSSLPGAGEVVVDGNVVVAGTASVELASSAAGDFLMYARRDIEMNTSGALIFATNGRGAMAVGRDVIIIRGTISESGAGTGEFRFDNSRLHRFRRGVSGSDGTFSGRINYRIAPGDTLDLANAVLSNGVGNGNANELVNSGTLCVGSLDIGGAIQNNTTGGNVRTTVSGRTFTPGSSVIYNASLPQFMANAGVATGSGTITVIDNPTGVNIISNVSLGSVHLERGELFITSARTLALSGGMTRRTGWLQATATSALSVSDSLPGPVILFMSDGDLTLGTFTIDRRMQNASVTIATPLRIASQLNLTHGELVHSNTIILEDNATLSRWPAASLTQRVLCETGNHYNVTYRSMSVSGGPYAKTVTGLELPDHINELNILNMAMAQSSDTVVLGQDLIIGTLLDMNRGRFYAGNHTIEFRGSVWSDDIGNFGYGASRVIFSDSTSIQGSSNSTFHSIRATSGSTLRFTRNATIFGEVDFEPGSDIHADNITLTLSGGSNQFVSASGTTVGNLTITKSNLSLVQLTSPLLVKGLVRFNAPSSGIDLRSDGFLTLVSSADTAALAFGTGMIYRLQNGNTVTGQVTVQRYLSGEGRIYRYLASPVSNASVSSWKDDFAITGNFRDPSPAATICGTRINPLTESLFYYDESRATNDRSGYVAYPLKGMYSNTAILETGKGYAAFIRQCDSPTVVDVTGTVNQQLINLPVTFTPGASLQGWNLVGNPYPCTIDWDITGAQGWTRTNISPAIAIRDNGGGGFYRYWDGDGDPADLAQGRIAPGQAFWIRTTAPDPVLMIREGVKVIQEAEYYREVDTLSVLILNLVQSQTSLADKAYIKVRTGASPTLDAFDCPKLDNVLFDISTRSHDGVPLAINAVDHVACEDSLAVAMHDMEAGTYTLQATTKGKFSEAALVLYDALLDKDVDFTGLPYVFQVTADDVSENRFTIRWKPRQGSEVFILRKEHTLCDGQAVELELSEYRPNTTYEVWEGGLKISSSLGLLAASFTPGEHSVKIRTVTACRSSFLPGDVTIFRESPAVVQTVSNPVCLEGEALLEATSNSGTIYWYESEYALDYLSAGPLFMTPAIIKPATYFVLARTERGCESVRVAVTARVVLFDPVEIVQVDAHTLRSSYPAGNRWYFQDDELASDTGQVIQANISGVYSVRNRVGECFTEGWLMFSAPEIGRAILYPIPSGEYFTLEADFERILQMELLTVSGALALRFDTESVGRKKIGIFDVSNIQSGLYFLRIKGIGIPEDIRLFIKK